MKPPPGEAPPRWLGALSSKALLHGFHGRHLPGPLAASLTHRCAHNTHVHTLTKFTLSALLGQETAQCSEAPFSVFVVISAWLLGRGEG